MIVRELITLLSFRTQRNGLSDFDKAVDRVEGRIRGLSTAIGTAAGVLIANAASSALSSLSNSGRFLVESGDQLIQTGNRIRSAIDDVGEAQGIIERIYQDALQTGIQMNDTANVFARFAPALRTAGLDNSRALDFIGGLQRGLLVSGSTVAEAASTVRQLGQAFNSGVLRGEEFNSLLENGGKVARLFAEEMGVSIAQLREMAEKGQLTVARITAPMERAFARLRSEFGGMEVTYELATARLTVRLRRFAGDLVSAFGFTAMIVQRLESVNEWLERTRLKLPELGRRFQEFGGWTRLVEVFGSAVAAVLGAIFILNIGAATAAITRLGTAFAIATIKSTAFLALVGSLFLLLDDLRVWMSGGESLLGEQFGNFEDFFNGLGERFREAIRGAFGDIGVNVFDDITKAIDAVKVGLYAIRLFLTGEWGGAWNIAGSAVTMFFDTTAGPIALFLVSLWGVVKALQAAAAIAGVARAVSGGVGGSGGAAQAGGAAARAGGLGARLGAGLGILGRLSPYLALGGAAFALGEVGSETDRSPEGQADRRRAFGARGNASGFYGQSLEELERSMEGGPAPSTAAPTSGGSAPQVSLQSDFNINIDVTATTDADTLAATIRDQIGPIREAISAEMNMQARRLGQSVPRMEVPAQ